MVYNLKEDRPLTALGHFEAHGFRMFEDEDLDKNAEDVDMRMRPATYEDIVELGSSMQRSLMGNSFHVASIGSMILYCLVQIKFN